MSQRIADMLQPAFEAHKMRPGPHDRTNGRGRRKRVSPSWRRMARQARASYTAFDFVECAVCGQPFSPGALDQVLLHEHRGLSERGPTGIRGEPADGP